MNINIKIITIFAFIAFSCFSQFVCAQEQDTKLDPFFKVEIFADKISAGYEFPIAARFSGDISAGIGAANEIAHNKLSIVWSDQGKSYAGFFIRGQIRYYLNRTSRGKKGRSLKNNAGSFLGFQSKFNTNGGNKVLGSALLNDIHFGQQLPLGDSFFIRYQLGLGYGHNFGQNYSTMYPALGIFIGYAF